MINQTVKLLLTGVLLSGLFACSTTKPVTYFDNIYVSSVVHNPAKQHCPKVSSDYIANILRTGKAVSEQEVLDQGMLRGCTVDGTLTFNKQPHKFIYEYGGLLFLDNGKILACTKNCI